MNLQFIRGRRKSYSPVAARAIPLVLGLFLILSNGVATAATRIDDVKTLLAGYEWQLRPARFLCNANGMDAALREIASDETLPNYYRLRALAALGLFPNPDTAMFLEQVISDSGSHPSRVQQALHAYTRAYAGKQPGRVTEVARNALELNEDYQIRTAAVQTLASLDMPAARGALQTYLKSGLSDLQRQQIKTMMHESKVTAGRARDKSGAPSRRSQAHDCTTL